MLFKRKNKKVNQVSEIEAIKNNLVEFQTEIGEYDDTKKSIEEFSKVSYTFYNSAMSSVNEEELLNHIKVYVLKINKINEAAGFGLIETMEREEIYLFIVSVYTKLGYEFDYDVTEEYREW